MSIENTLERIAVALEKIAGGAGSITHESKEAEAISKAASVAKKVTDEIKEKQEAVRTDKKEETKTDAPEIKWADVNKAFFNALGKIKKEQGLDAAKEVSAKFAQKYSGGQQPKADNTDVAQYAEFLADIDKELKARKLND